MKLFSRLPSLSLLLAATLLSACVPPSAVRAPANPEPLATTAATMAPTQAAKTSVLRVGMADALDTRNPIMYGANADSRIFILIYDWLFTIGPDGKNVPSLVTSDQVSDDKKTWTFKIRSGVKFHDGQPLTARDAAFTLNLYHKREDSPTNFVLAQMDKAEAPDDSTLVVHMKTQVADLENRLAYMPIVPAHIWEPLDDGSKKVAEFANEAMIGSGPYKLINYDKSTGVHMAAVQDYWGGAPKFDELMVQVITDTPKLVQALADGKLDAIYSVLDPKGAESLSKIPNVQVVNGDAEAPTLQMITVNQLDPKLCPKDTVCSGHPALRDVRVRTAIRHAIDSKALADAGGLGTPGVQLLPTSMNEWSNTSLKGFGLDIAEANKILDDAGYKDTDGDGIRQMPDGSHPLIFHSPKLGTAYSLQGTAPSIFAVLADALKPIGMKLEDVVSKGFYDLDFSPLGFTVPDPSTMFILADSNQIGGWNVSGYSNPEFDTLNQQQAAEFDHDKRKDMIWKMQEILDRDTAFIVVNYPGAASAIRTDTFSGWPTDAKMRVMPLYPSVLRLVKPV